MATQTINLSSAYEARQLEAFTKPYILPVAIITGFLGGGKTTLLQKLIRDKRNLHIVTLVNDFGARNHDAEVIARMHPSAHEQRRQLELHDGCMCCTSEHQTEMRDGIWDILQAPQDGINYLVIETSGVTDPTRIIQTLDERFGKMTRARLDVVCTVVDADTFTVPSTNTNPRSASAAASQLESADVVLVNKADLVSDERLEEIEAAVKAVNPLARVHRTVYCDLPLSHVLDVELVQESAGAMTHEAKSCSYVPRSSLTTAGPYTSAPQSSSADGERLRSASLSRGKKPASHGQQGQTQQLPHLQADGLSTFTHRSTRPFSLPALQSVLASRTVLPLSLLRIKGVVYVCDLPRPRRLLLSMSGRRRWGVDDDGEWTSTPTTELTFIGTQVKDTESQALIAALHGACVEPGGGIRDGMEGASVGRLKFVDDLRALLASDNRFEVLPSMSPAMIALRLSGAGSLGMTPELLKLKHGVDLSGLSRALQQRINVLGAGLVLFPWEDGEHEGALCLAVGEDGDERMYRRFVDVLREQATIVLKEGLNSVRLCKCGC